MKSNIPNFLWIVYVPGSVHTLSVLALLFVPFYSIQHYIKVGLLLGCQCSRPGMCHSNVYEPWVYHTDIPECVGNTPMTELTHNSCHLQMFLVWQTFATFMLLFEKWYSWPDEPCSGKITQWKPLTFTLKYFLNVSIFECPFAFSMLFGNIQIPF